MIVGMDNRLFAGARDTGPDQGVAGVPSLGDAGSTAAQGWELCRPPARWRGCPPVWSETRGRTRLTAQLDEGFRLETSADDPSIVAESENAIRKRSTAKAVLPSTSFRAPTGARPQWESAAAPFGEGHPHVAFKRSTIAFAGEASRRRPRRRPWSPACVIRKSVKRPITAQ